jgi:tripartite-type tricarboxylate transporter receptor subunit TctC
MIRQIALKVGLGLGITAAAVAQVAAQSYPTRPIKMIVPFPAGGPTDVMARFVAQRLSATLGQVIVENRPGAGGVIGSKAVASAEPDGHTLLFGSTGTLAISPTIYANLDYDPIKAFTPIARVAEVPYLVVVHPTVPATTVRELVTYAKANPSKLNFGATNATPPHLACELLKVATGTAIMHVPYKGGSQAITDVLGGQIQMTCDQTTVLLSHVQEGKLRALAAMSATRLPQLPQVPTMIESGYADFLVTAWFGVVGPAGLPPSIVARLNAEINAALQSPEMRANLGMFGAEPLSGTAQDFADFLAKEIPRWGAIARSSGAKIE